MSLRFLARPMGIFSPVAAVLLALSPIGCRQDQISSDSAQRAPVAPVAVVRRAHLENVFEVEGEFIPYQQVELHAKVAGYIRHINVDIGDKVKAGQVIAMLDIPE